MPRKTEPAMPKSSAAPARRQASAHGHHQESGDRRCQDRAIRQKTNVSRVAEELLQAWLSGQNKLQRKVVRNEPEFP